MKLNKWVLYFLYGLLLLGFIIFGHNILEYLEVQASRTYDSRLYMIWSTIIFIVGGILLGLERFILEVKKKGSWKVNWPKALFLGVPSISLALIIFLPIFLPTFSESLYESFYFSFLFLSIINIVPIFQMGFGYILITSFIKIE